MSFQITFFRKNLLLTCLTVICLSTFGILPNIAQAQPPPSTKIYVDPVTTIANPGDSFAVDINIADVVDLYSWSIKIRWNRDVLECTGATEGPFLKGQPGGTAFSQEIYDVGYLEAVCTTLGLWPGVSGSGTLMTATFNVIGTGETALDIDDSLPLDSGLVPIAHTVEDGYFYTTWPVASFTYTPNSTTIGSTGRPLVGEDVTFDASASYDPDGGSETYPSGIVSYEWDFGDGATGTGMIVTHAYDAPSLPGEYNVTLTVTDDESETYSWHARTLNDLIVVKFHDIAVLDVTVDPEKVPAGNLTQIYVTVMNNGSHYDTFNVTVYYFDYRFYHAIATYREVIGLAAGATAELGNSSLYPTSNLIWNTTGVSPGLYPIWADAYLVDKGFINERRLGEEENTANNARVGGPANVTLKEIMRDINITDVTVSPTDVKVGQTVNVNVHVKNEGNVGETFIVSVNGTLNGEDFALEDKSVTLVAGDEKTLHFSWFEPTNETAVQSAYNVSAWVPPLTDPDENVTTNNTFENVTGTIRLLPVAYFTYSPSEPIISQTVTFDGSPSYAPGIPTKTIDSYSWDFGDDTSDTGITTTHVYDSSGSYSVTLTVVDSDGLSDTYGQSVTVPKLNSTITVSASVTTVPVGSGTVLAGAISPVSAGANASIYYVQSGEETWISLANVTTDDDGQYSYNWVPWSKPGTYEVKANWTGNGNTLPAESSVIVIDVIQKTTSTIDISASSTTITIGTSITIDGSISPVRAGVNVTIWHMPSGSDWSTLANVTTDDEGAYVYDWEPANSGTHILKASWPGDETTDADESDVQVIAVEEVPAPNIFLYSTVGLAIVFAVTVVYFLWVKKPKPA